MKNNVLLLYSLVKYIFLYYARSLFVPSALSFAPFLGFYATNLCLLAAFGAVFSLLAYFIAAVKQPYAIVTLLLVSIPYFLILFITLNAAHSIFHARSTGVFRTIKQAFA